ncbi:MAG: SH3 domain-containing protein [Parasporobacterium sp.]|nr:SH3 domain-containing protein [Parasporobacterium sp.]
MAFIFTFSAFSCIALNAAPAFAGECRVTDYEVNVRSGPGAEYESVGYAYLGYTFTSEGTEVDGEGNVWYKVDYNGRTGYISDEFVDPDEMPVGAEESSDAEDNEAPDADVSDSAGNNVDSGHTDGTETTDQTDETGNDSEEPDDASDDTEETETDTEAETPDEEDEEAELLTASQPSWSGHIQSEAEFEAQLAQFPASYRAGIRAVHAVYPNYTFTADYVNMDFQEVVDAEACKKVASYYYDGWKAMYDESFGIYENYNWDTGEWYESEGTFTYASREVIEYYVDPRNFLNTDDIYMFMRQSYTPDQTIDDLRSALQGSFLADGYVPNKYEPNDVRCGGDYAVVIMEAAQASGTNPFVLAAHFIGEHGYQGSTPLISGYYQANDGTVYRNYYNFFDIGATGGSSDNVIQNGLEYAKSAGWTSRYLAIVNGAVWNSEGYGSNNQDTYYYREFNVINGWDNLWHQYSTAVQTAWGSTYLMAEAFQSNQYAALNFRIPVYTDMPDVPASMPQKNDYLNNYYFTDMKATGLVPEFSMANREYSMTVTGDTVLNVSVPQWASYESSRYFELYPGTNYVYLDVMSQTGYLRTYTITVNSATYCSLTVNTYTGNRLDVADDPASGSVWGDANGDGKVSVLDYIAIKNHIMETRIITDAARLKAADANGDGRVSALDYIAIKNYIMSY